MDTLETYLEQAEKSHGHMCAGQVLGVRMAMLGCATIGITDPRHSQRKSILVFVEIDRCAADAINTVTGCRLGKRTLKYHDYGKLAATFLNLQTGKAIRIVALDSARELADRTFPDIENRYERQLQAYKILPDASLFKTEWVNVEVPVEDQPGRPVSRVTCEACGEGINDRREVVKDGRLLCRACAGDAYFTRI